MRYFGTESSSFDISVIQFNEISNEISKIMKLVKLQDLVAK